ncbi:MAG: hypothetical protein HYR96_08490 [Deltaproteobacteria bacterium]|nr:hypothetical protein [Deltaproteobacteria bacterium]MBI3294649.1 hypothetical protein [Deltaproteobacteria bacterium]
MKIVLAALVAAPLFASSFCSKYSEGVNGRQLLTSRWQERDVAADRIVERRAPRYFVEHSPVSSEQIVEVCAPKAAMVFDLLASRKVMDRFDDGDDEGAQDEVFTLIENGNVKNRINLVFMGDGYTANEKEKFLTDMKRLTAQIFESKTFASYLPIFNVFAVFRPSHESGIGKNDTPKDTAFKLYRQGDTLRAIFTGNATAAHDACSKAPGCDYPILIGNDPHYGGLGGEFSISTSSPRSGMVVLRHELGHSVGEIGEEYDGGGYFGANHSYSVSSLGWSHWTDGSVAEEPSVARNVSWPWVNLSKGPYTAKMTSDGKWDSLFMTISLSGLQTSDDVVVKLDGEQLPIDSEQQADRKFYDFKIEQGFSSGTHQLTFEEKVHDGDNWVSNITVHEFKKEYNFDSNHIGAYPLFQGSRREGYRPTHNTCLMRNMMSDQFCPVCKENNWIKFFATVSMIDSIESHAETTGQRVFVKTQPLGQFRHDGRGEGQYIAIRWYKDGELQSEFLDQTEIVVTEPSAKWEVEVELTTPEVRKDLNGVLKARRKVTF